MGYVLRRWLRDQLPPECSSGERLVALELADAANDETRRCWPSTEELAQWTGLAPKTVSEMLRRLALRGWEFRVELGKDKQGRPVFAYAGKKTVYLIPGERANPRGAFEQSKRANDGGPSSEEGPTMVGPKAPQELAQRANGFDEMGPQELAPSPQSPQGSPQSSPQGSDTPLRSVSAPHSGRRSVQGLISQFAGARGVAPAYKTSAGNATSAPTARPVHPFADDGAGYCSRCLLPSSNRSHITRSAA